MHHRTRSRSRAHSQASASVDEDIIAVGLQRLLDKLRQYQPFFTEEDDAASPFPSENGGSCTSSASPSMPVSPRVSPSRLDNEELQAQQESRHLAAASPPPAAAEEGRSKRPAFQPSETAGARHAVSSSIDLDGPLSPALFVTAVNLFDAKMLAKSKRAAADALKLVRQAYALIWKDADYLATLMNGEPYRGANGACASQRGHRALHVEEAPALNRSSKGAHRVSFSTAAPSPAQQPARQLTLLLDECIRALLVYANVSVNLCHSVSFNIRVLLLLCFVCCAARRVEERDDVPYGEGRGSAADIIVGNRNLHTELESLSEVWQDCGIEGRVADALHECYLLEFLLDAALPPAVCSSRYDGLLTAVFEKKRRIISDVVASRSGFARVMSVAPLRGLCGLANMSAFGDAKLRARLLDKMASEGIVERLSSEIASAMEVILDVGSALPPSRSPLKRHRSTHLHGTSPPHQRSRASASAPPSRRTSVETFSQPSRTLDGDAGKAGGVGVDRVSTGLDRMLNTQPTPVERIGQCVDILMLLSSPNLSPSEGNETSATSSRASSPSGVVRATTWASHEAALHDISLHLLAICFLSKRHARYAELSSLQLYAADCVLQWAAYSGKFYTLVVHALDELLDTTEAMDSERDSRTVSPAPQPPASPSASPTASRSPPTEPMKRPRDAAVMPGHRLLRQLLPGDETGLLPLLTNLLQYTIHAEANATSIRRWFQFLANRVLPSVFEAPQLTAGRRSTAAWGRRRQREAQQLLGQPSSQKSSHASSLPRTSATTMSASVTGADAEGVGSPAVLARDLTRAEVAAAAPYFRFVREVVEETSWRAGTTALFGKVVALAFNVIVTHGHRCNLVFGQACACYDTAAPLLLTMQSEAASQQGSRCSSRERRRSTDGSNGSSYRCSTILMHQLRVGEEEEEEEEEEARRQSLLYAVTEEGGSPRRLEEWGGGPDKDGVETFIESAVKGRSPPACGCPRGSPATAVSRDEETDLSPFISSLSGSPVYYEPCSPLSAVADVSRNSSDGSSSPSGEQHRGSDLRAALEEAAATPPPPADESPQPIALSWTRHLSLRSLLSSISGHGEAPRKHA